MQGRFREQEALVGACCITRGKVLGAVEEREEEQREEVMALPSQQQNPLSGRKVAVTWDPDLSLQGKKVPLCRPGG